MRSETPMAKKIGKGMNASGEGIMAKSTEVAISPDPHIISPLPERAQKALLFSSLTLL